MTTQQHASPAARPMTGEEYIESLRDGREVYLYGDRVEDVTTHPAFRNSVRMTARLYDALHDAPSRRRPDLPDRHRQRRLHACATSAPPALRRTWWATATPSPPGRG